MKYGVDYRDEGGRTALMYSVLGNHSKLTEVTSSHSDLSFDVYKGVLLLREQMQALIFYFIYF